MMLNVVKDMSVSFLSLINFEVKWQLITQTYNDR